MVKEKLGAVASTIEAIHHSRNNTKCDGGFKADRCAISTSILPSHLRQTNFSTNSYFSIDFPYLLTCVFLP